MEALDGDLVELDALQAQLLAVVVGAAALLEPLQRLALARGLGELLAPLIEDQLVPPEIGLRGAVGALGPLQVRLVGEVVGAAVAPSCASRAAAMRSAAA
jgi:hypothetical protein